MLSLPQVTLCCVDTRLPEMALQAMQTCMAKVHFGDAVLFTCPDHGLLLDASSPRVVEVDSIRSIEDYSRYLLKSLGPHIHTSHLLIVQWDGYVLNPQAWEPGFLEFDYIGPVWPQYHDGHRVGNGGFSLRSRKLLDALSHPDVVAHHPEDVCIARTCRAMLESRWGIRFADDATADRFAFERHELPFPSFGFHGMSNFPLVMPRAELTAFVAQAPASFFGSVEARRFVKRLLQLGLREEALTVLRKRAQIRRRDWSDVRLWVRCAWPV